MTKFAIMSAAALLALGGSAFAAKSDDGHTIGVPLNAVERVEPVVPGRHFDTRTIHSTYDLGYPQSVQPVQGDDKGPFYTPSNQR